MGFLELMLLAVGLSMDALAVSICKGLAMDRVTLGRMVLVGLWFGGFQGLMPLLGWLLGSRFSLYITAIDHWIAFALLAPGSPERRHGGGQRLPGFPGYVRHGGGHQH